MPAITAVLRVSKLCELCVSGVYVRDTPVHRWNLDKGWPLFPLVRVPVLS